ncbi:transcriptional regulator opi1 [Coemansia sp. RSA 1939]|nr:transcriptional regulator opi1 [Coemansia sp. RSA 1939]KAJ2611053.1 transcriptional regulator opi1 [Coemansia sp. RSA 1804]
MVEAAHALESLRGEENHQQLQKKQQPPLFIKRVQAIPLVGSGVIESGVRRMCEPITKRIDVSQLDSFACRQLDNLGYTMEHDDQQQQQQNQQQHSEQLQNQNQNQNNQALHYQWDTRPSANLRKRTKDQADRQQSPPANGWVPNIHHHDSYTNGKPRQQNEVSVSASASASSGGRGWIVGSLVASAKERAIAYREDSMRRLKYCLDWVVYAAALISQHMRDLRALLASLHESAHIVFSSGSVMSGEVVDNGGYSDGDAAVVCRDLQTQQQQQQQQLQQQRYQQQHELALRLAKARREIVGAVRKAVGVVSNYAGTVLPGEARRQVRGLILGMPGRWMAVDSAAAASQSGASSVGTPSVVSEINSSPSSPLAGPTAVAGSSSLPSDMAPANIEATTRRTLAFASESYQMLSSISGVFTHLYTNAERWVGTTSAAAPDHGSQLSQNLDQNQNPQPPADPFSTYRDSNGSAIDGVRLPPVARHSQRKPPLNMTPMSKASTQATGGDNDGYSNNSEAVGAAGDSAAEAISRLSTSSSSPMATMLLGDKKMKRRSFSHITQNQSRSQNQQQPLLFGAASTKPASATASPMLWAAGSAGSSLRHSRYDYDDAAVSASDDGAEWVAHKRNRTREPTPTRM